VSDNKQTSDNYVHEIRLGKGQRLANKTSIGLSQSVIPAFHVVGLSFSFSNTLMRIWREDQLIGFPQIAETLTTFITSWDPLPEKLAGLLTSITNGIGDNLACPTTHRSPNPSFSPLFLHKRPHFVHFKNIFSLCW
jgi:hypothetical protein